MFVPYLSYIHSFIQSNFIEVNIITYSITYVWNLYVLCTVKIRMETDTQHCTGVMFYFNFLKLKREALSISFLFYHFAHLWGLTICYKVLLSNFFLVPDVWVFEVLARPNLPIYRNWTDKNINGRQQWSLLRDCQKCYFQSRAAFNLIQPWPLTALRCNSVMSCIKLRNVGNIYLKNWMLVL